MIRIRRDRLAAYLTRVTADWPRSDSPPPEELAEILLSDVAFRAFRLGTVFRNPSEPMLTAAAKAVTPPLADEDVALLVEALRLAGRHLHDEMRGHLAAAVALTLGAGATAPLVADGDTGTDTGPGS